MVHSGSTVHFATHGGGDDRKFSSSVNIQALPHRIDGIAFASLQKTAGSAFRITWSCLGARPVRS